MVQSAARLRLPDPRRWNARHLRAYGNLAPLRPDRIAAGPVCPGALWTRAEGIDGGRGAPRGRPARTGLTLTQQERCHAGAGCGRAASKARFRRCCAAICKDLRSLCYDRRSSIEALSMRRCLLVLLAALSVLTLPSAGVRLAAAELQPLEIASKSGVHVFAVEMASTPEEVARGLMFRRQLPEGQGMLFDFHKEQPTSFWMKNTYIPLDMIFIRADGRILHIAENRVPLSDTLVPSGGPVRAVLEVIGGTAKKLGIAPGDRVGHAIFGGRR